MARMNDAADKLAKSFLKYCVTEKESTQKPITCMENTVVYGSEMKWLLKV